MSEESSTPPSEHAMRRARDQGKIAYSNHLAVAVTSIGILGIAVILGKSLMGAAMDDLSSSLSSVHIPSEESLYDADRVWNRPLLRPVALFIGSITLVAIFSRIIQVGITLQPSRALPNAAHIDFAKGMQRIFSISNVIRCCQIFVATLAFVLLLSVFFAQNYASLVSLGIAEVERLPGLVSAEFAKLFAIASMIALMVGIVDFYWQRTKFISELQNEESGSRRPVQAILNERRPANRR